MPRPGQRQDAHLANCHDQTSRLSAANSHSSADFLSGRGRRTSRTEARPVEGSEGAAKLPRPRAAADAHFAALPLVRSPATRSARLPSLRSAHFAPRRASPLARHFRPAGGLGRSPITPRSRSSKPLPIPSHRRTSATCGRRRRSFAFLEWRRLDLRHSAEHRDKCDCRRVGAQDARAERVARKAL